jgi:hypothetical protein
VYIQIVILALANFNPLDHLSFKTGELPTAIDLHHLFLTNSLIGFHIVLLPAPMPLGAKIPELVGAPTSGVASQGGESCSPESHTKRLLPVSGHDRCGRKHGHTGLPRTAFFGFRKSDIVFLNQGRLLVCKLCGIKYLRESSA